MFKEKAGRTIAVDEFKVQQFAYEVMGLMEEKGFNYGEAMMLPKILKIWLERNEKRLADSKPFNVYKAD